MTPAELHARLDDRMFEIATERRVSPWHAGVKLMAARLDVDARLLWDGTWALGAVFASVLTDPADPRRFVVPGVAERMLAVGQGDASRATPSTASRSPSPERGGMAYPPTPAVLFLHAQDPDGPGGGAYAGDDLIAWSLAAPGAPLSRRVWRWTGACAYLGELRPDAAGVTRLYQDPHLWLKRMVASAAWRRRAREARARAVAAAHARGLDGPAALRAGEGAAMAHRVEQAPPAGALVLDPAAIAWTRAGVLAEAEAVEILDAPVDGPLGRALTAMNPRLGTARGIPLRGTVAAPPKQGRRAA